VQQLKSSLFGPVYIRSGAVFVTSASLDANPVVPGGQVPITWDLFSTKPKDLNLGTVTARVYLEKVNVKLYESPQTPLVVSEFIADTGFQHANIEVPDSGGTANDLYHIGTKTLRLDVSADKSSDVFSDTVDLRVVPEYVHGGWWEWGGISGTADPSAPQAPNLPFETHHDFVINHPFTLAGRIVNHSKSPNATMTGSLTLLETAFLSNQTLEVESRTFTIAPGGYQEIVFAPITKNWGWLIPGAWIENPKESRVKTFDYTVRFSLADPYGNFYPETLSNGVAISISVSDEKRGYASGALAALGAAIISAIFTFGAGLSAGQAIAAGLGKKALDPPEPDQRFRHPVDVRSNELANDVTGDPRFPEFRRVLRFAERAVALLDALGEIHARLLGARTAHDRKAISLQGESYRAAEHSLQATVRELIDSTASTVTTLQADPEFDRESLRAKILAWQRNGLPPDVRRRLTDGGCTEETLAQMMLAVQEPAVALLAQDVGQVLSLLAWSLGLVAREVNREAPKLLSEQERPPLAPVRRPRKRSQ